MLGSIQDPNSSSLFVQAQLEQGAKLKAGQEQLNTAGLSANGQQLELESRAVSSPSTLVEIGGANVAQDVVYKPPVIVWSPQSRNESDSFGITDALFGQLNKGDTAPNLSTSLSQLSTLVREGVNEYSQSARLFATSGAASSDKTAAATGYDASLSSAETQTSVDMELKTRDGDTIRFSLKFGVNKDGGLSPTVELEYSLDGKLSEQEQKDIDALAKSFQKQAETFFRSGDVDLSQLDISKFGSISDVDIRFDDANNNKSLIEGSNNNFHFQFSRTDDEDQLNISLNGNNIQLGGSRSIEGLLQEIKQEQSSRHYLELIGDSVDEAHGTEEQKKLIQDAFALIHGELNDTKAGSADVSERDSSLLTGLRDFDLKFTSTVKQPNKEQKPWEAEGFELNISQKTEVIGRQSDRNIQQSQDYKLNASFYDSVDYLDDPDFDTQTYRYTVMQKEANTTTIQSYDDFELQSAMSYSSQSEDKNVKEYQLGKLVSDVDSEDHKESLQDYTEQLAQTDQQLELLDAILIDVDF